MKLGLRLGLDYIIQMNASKGVLNPFNDATVAYSLRDLNLGVTSNVVRVRRSSDNLEQDFTATQVTDGTLTSFCGAGDGFVSVWYDQKGLYDASQVTASSQPKIVSLGSLILENGNPTLIFEGNQSLFNSINNLLSTAYSAFMINKAELGFQQALLRCRALGNYGVSEGAAFLEYDTNNGSINIFIDDGEGDSIGVTNSVFSNLNQFELITTILTINSASTFRNSVNVGGSNSVESGSIPLNNVTLPFLDIGGGQVNRAWIGSVSEIILFDSDLTQNRQEIETNINNYYAIY